jgi:RNA polymerase sigma factor (sigma-70 family)
MYNTAYRYCFNKVITEDILQITFTKVFRSIDQYDPKKGSLKAWIRRICVNAAVDVLKKEAKWEPLLDLNYEAIETNNYLNQIDAEFLLKLIQELPSDQRLIFNLYEIEGYSHQEIAAITGINVNSCRVYLSRAKDKLRATIKKLEGV